MTDLEPGRVQESSSGAEELVRGELLSKFFAVRQATRRKTRLVRAVQGASIGIAAGETVGLVGESGSGKTTLGRLLLRLVEPTFGRVWFEGRDITHYHERDLRPLRRRLQVLFQDAAAALDDLLSVADIVAEPLRIHGLASDPARVAELLDRVGLAPEIAARGAAELSIGQSQRVSIARALALEPRFIVCDEPIAALDAVEQRRMLDLLISLQRERRHSYLFISHDLRLVLHLSQRVYVMYAGHIVEHAAAARLREHSRHPYTRALAHSVPEVDPKRRRLRILLDGEPPSPFEPIAGCPFHPRCPRARPDPCEHELPPLEADAGDLDHEVACWFPLD
jgi:oligopeptide/dipeptide ABC transporter ATP-binding protein